SPPRRTLPRDGAHPGGGAQPDRLQPDVEQPRTRGGKNRARAAPGSAGVAFDHELRGIALRRTARRARRLLIAYRSLLIAHWLRLGAEVAASSGVASSIRRSHERQRMAEAPLAATSQREMA